MKGKQVIGRFRNRTNTRSIGNRYRNRMRKKNGSENPRLYEFIRRYEDEILELKKPSTITSWRKYYQDVIEAFGFIHMQDLDRQVLQPYFTALGKRLSPASVKSRWVALAAVLNYAVEEGIIDDYPRPTLPKIYRTTQQWLSIDEMRKLLANCTGRLHTFIMLLCETGCRVGEALGLQGGDLDEDGLNLSIKRTIYDGRPNQPKTESSIRTIAISEKLCYALKSLKHPSDSSVYLFRTSLGNPWRPSYVTRKLNHLYDRLKMQRKGFHAFRRGNITHLVLNLEIPESIVGGRVGHLSNGMTLGVYVQRIQGLDKKWIDTIADSLYEEE